jgi:hypothetical protein
MNYICALEKNSFIWNTAQSISYYKFLNFVFLELRVNPRLQIFLMFDKSSNRIIITQ